VSAVIESYGCGCKYCPTLKFWLYGKQIGQNPPTDSRTMRTLVSWLSVARVSLVTQVLTYIFSGIGIGYAAMVLQMYNLKRFEMGREIFGTRGAAKDVVTGLSDEDWNELWRAIATWDLDRVVSQMPVLGWWFLFGFLIGGTLSVLVINIATVIHLRRLRLGGQVMVEKLGALSFDENAPDDLRHLPKIVQELSAEFQLPMPKLFILTAEDCMNAFVVGRTPTESVLVVTRGLRLMNEQQLRGTIAHELAHVRNGDMAHNMRLLAVEFGANSVRHSADWMLRTGWNLLFGASNNRSALAGIHWGVLLIVNGLVLWPMGLISSLAGAAMMATSNRRRELRADRLAAKILGSWEPIGDALKRILGHDRRGRIAGPDGRKLGHLMFTQGNGNSGGMFATHPKIEKRIACADRRWDGIPLYENEDDSDPVDHPIVEESATLSLLSRLDPQVVAIFKDPDAIMLTVPTLLLLDDEGDSVASELSNGKLVDSIKALRGCIEGIDEVERFALLEMTLCQVRESNNASVQQMIEKIHGNTPGNAWSTQCWIYMFLEAIVRESKSVKVTCRDFDHCVRELLEVVSIGVNIGQGSTELRFHQVWGYTGLSPLSVMCINSYEFHDLDESVETLINVPKKLREDFANAFASSLRNGNHLGADEASFLRYLSLRLGVTIRASIVPGRQQ